MSFRLQRLRIRDVILIETQRFEDKRGFFAEIYRPFQFSTGGAVLSHDNGRMLYVPPGFAHGFCVLSREADVIYQVTEEYAPGLDRGIVWNDPEIGSDWPISEPILLRKHTRLPSLREADNNLVARWEEPS